jgi:hypothetical protein
MPKFLKTLLAWLTTVSRGMAVERAGLKIEVDLNGLIVTAHEATVIEIRNWLKGLVSARPFDNIDQLLFQAEDVTLTDLVNLSDASRTTLESLPPSLLIKLAEAVKEANPFFFRYRQTLFKLDKLQNSA